MMHNPHKIIYLWGHGFSVLQNVGENELLFEHNKIVESLRSLAMAII